MIARPPRSGILTSGGRYFATGSLSATSPRRTASASSSEVNTFVIEPISKTVSPSSGLVSPLARLPYATIRRPPGSITPTTMPTLCRCVSTRSTRILRISASDGTGEGAGRRLRCRRGRGRDREHPRRERRADDPGNGPGRRAHSCPSSASTLCSSRSSQRAPHTFRRQISTKTPMITGTPIRAPPADDVSHLLAAHRHHAGHERQQVPQRHRAQDVPLTCDLALVEPKHVLRLRMPGHRSRSGAEMRETR